MENGSIGIDRAMSEKVDHGFVRVQHNNVLAKGCKVNNVAWRRGKRRSAICMVYDENSGDRKYFSIQYT